MNLLFQLLNDFTLKVVYLVKKGTIKGSIMNISLEKETKENGVQFIATLSNGLLVIKGGSSSGGSPTALRDPEYPDDIVFVGYPIQKKKFVGLGGTVTANKKKQEGAFKIPISLYYAIIIGELILIKEGSSRLIPILLENSDITININEEVRSTALTALNPDLLPCPALPRIKNPHF